MYEQIKKNTVDSLNQLMKSEYVRIYNHEGKGVRVMFAGNSITLIELKKAKIVVKLLRRTGKVKFAVGFRIFVRH